MSKLKSSNVPIEIYHGVPKGWTKQNIISTYAILKGKFPIDQTKSTEPKAPSWLPDRYNWLDYRETLYKVAEGVRKGDRACIELAIRYIELNYFGSYSGFIREKLARALKSQDLSLSQIRRLNNHFQKLINNKQCFQEFKEYHKLRKLFKLSV